MKDSKNIVIGLLCAVVCVMAVAYAAFATTLNINGTASIDSIWHVAITTIDCEATAASGGEELEKPTASVTEAGGTSATFAIKFKQPGDTATCTVTITNKGTLNAKVKAITPVQDETENTFIQYELSGIDVDTKLISQQTNTYTITAKIPETETSLPSDDSWKDKSLTVTIEYVQDLDAE